MLGFSVVLFCVGLACFACFVLVGVFCVVCPCVCVVLCICLCVCVCLYGCLFVFYRYIVLLLLNGVIVRLFVRLPDGRFVCRCVRVCLVCFCCLLDWLFFCFCSCV